MKFAYSFENLLELKEREKDEAYVSYQNAVHQFEKAATKLYESLKKKEQLEKLQSNQLKKGFTINHLRQYQQYMQSTIETIDYWQLEVIQAREQMESLKETLFARNIECKKYERLKEKNKEAFLQVIQHHENIQMDELAAIQYSHRKGN